MKLNKVRSESLLRKYLVGRTGADVKTNHYYLERKCGNIVCGEETLNMCYDTLTLPLSSFSSPRLSLPGSE